MNVAILTNRREQLSAFASGLDCEVDWMDSADAVLGAARSAPWHLLVVDTQMPDMKYRPYITELLRANAMLNTAVITDQAEADFHEESEGLGILCAVSGLPTQRDGRAVGDKLRVLLGL